MPEGYARITVAGPWHLWSPFETNSNFLISDCRRGSLLPRHGAKLKTRAELPEGAVVCSWCERKEDS